ncbi:uncharacterized protein LOC111360641 [Spodoptera litura]|uniref:trypsin n=1 Tax=Spodoptera litura TaxID=69820 RepID=A0A9J7EQ78_SPOLT|nr:uncharacterized protein LOC111360641 [Spodoptera litura]
MILVLLVLFIPEQVLSDLRLLGGKDVNDTDYRFVVRLEAIAASKRKHHRSMVQDIHVCTGVVLSEYWTLTAAHCVVELEDLTRKTNKILRKAVVRVNSNKGTRQGPEEQPEDIAPVPEEKPEPKQESVTKPTPVTEPIRVTTTTRTPFYTTTQHPKSVTTTYAIVAMYKHSGYRDVSVNENIHVKNDIAMLQTDQITLQEYGKVGSGDFTSLIGYESKILGYGLRQPDGDTSKAPRLLQLLHVLVVECPPDNEMYPVICVAAHCKTERAMLCKGDAGGPLISFFGVIGLIGKNTNVHCIQTTITSATTVGHLLPLSPYLTWITSHILNTEPVAQL